MVIMCPKCKRKIACVDDETGEVGYCHTCPIAEICDRDRYELARPLLCRFCRESDKQLKIPFPEEE